MSPDNPTESNVNPPAPDPLGLAQLGRVVADLARERNSRAASESGSAPWRLQVNRLEQVFADVAEKYELLRDRYGLLKRLNAQLADELTWLRDQCDDLASAPRPSEPHLEPEATDAKKNRRYTDRFRT